MFGSMFSGTETGGWSTAKGGCGPRERIARVEAGLVLLDSFAEDKSALVFDWENCDSVAHESQRNSLLNTLVADISDCSHRQGGYSPTWRQVILARLRRRSRDNTCSQHVENLLNEAATPLQHRCPASRTATLKRVSSWDGSQESRRVSLMFWPPEVIPSACHDDTTGVNQLAAHPPNSPSRGAPVVDSALTDRSVSAVALLLESRDRARAVVRGAPELRGILVDKLSHAYRREHATTPPHRSWTF
jgi:hypothetical protein